MSYVEQRLEEIRQEQSRIPDKVREKAIISALRTEKIKQEPNETKWMKAARVGYVYFVRSSSLVKIGFSTNVLNRIIDLQVGNPIDATLVAAIPGSEDTEKYFHHMFKHHREKGEWFRVEGELEQFLSRMPSHVVISNRDKRIHAKESEEYYF